MRKIEFSQEQIDDILTKYNNNWTQQKLGDYYQVSRKTIKRILDENKENIILRERTQKYNGNYDIFEIIDTSEKAYWLGFLAADGCNYAREHNASIIININQKDISHLKKFQKFCNTNAKINQYIINEGYSNNTPMARLTLNSKKMSNDLSNKGIVPRKSLILKPPIISEEFYLPFILGYFDGDGSISKTSQYNNFTISIQGTQELLLWICSILNWEAKLEKRNTNDNKNSYYIRCGGTNKPYYILKQLYDSCKIHLDRKYELYKILETVVLGGNVK